MANEISTMNLTPNNIAGGWGWKLTNESQYMRSGVAGAAIFTDDGILRTAYPINLESGRTLYNRPQCISCRVR